MKKIIIILLALSSLVVALFVWQNLTIKNSPVGTNSQVSNMPDTNTLSASVLIDYGDTQSPEYPLNLAETTNAFDALLFAAEKEGKEIKSTQYDFGVFIETVGSMESSAEKAWIYFVNGNSGQVAADQYELNEGDKIEWKFIAPTDN